MLLEVMNVGFSGRANKLVDSCYCYWVYALLPLIAYAKARLGKKVPSDYDLDYIDRNALVNYILCFAQSEDGGFRDRYPGHVDFYHTCYSLCSLSLAVYDMEIDTDNFCNLKKLHKLYEFEDVDVNPIHPLFGMPVENLQDALRYFRKDQED